VGNGTSATQASAPSHRRRAALAESVRRDLLNAASAIVSRHGYASASISKITKAAGVASGTFYLYFPSQQAIFDRLLPLIGSRLLEHIEKHVDPDSTGFQYEKQRVDAYFDFCRLNPGFLRIYHEAAVFAPQAYRKHFRRLADGYRDTINKSRERGELPLFEEKEIESLIYILMGARSYLSLLYASGRKENPVSTLIEVYLKVVKSGVFGGADKPLKLKRPNGVAR
jgi:AcrR family transcriptional regulator